MNDGTPTLVEVVARSILVNAEHDNGACRMVGDALRYLANAMMEQPSVQSVADAAAYLRSWAEILEDPRRH